MNLSLSGKTWLPRDVDRALLLVVLANGLAAAWLAWTHGRLPAAAALVAFPVLLTGLATWRWPGTLSTRLVIAASLAVLAGTQAAMGADPGVCLLNVHLSLGILLAYRDWRPIAALGGLSAVQLMSFERLVQSGWITLVPPLTAKLSWALPVLFLALLTATLCALAIVQQHQARAASELEFLVKAMGREGKILLNLDVIRAETPIGQRLQHVQQRMADAIRAVHEAAQRVDMAAQKVAAGSGELMSRTEATANGLRDAVMSLDQINVIVKHSTEASTEAKQMSDTAAGIADRGGELVGNVVQTMKDIESSSKRINDIIGVIDGIAFQTNILALNAAVEAARAGEQGRGFAVVASEVRSLASRSAAAAKEIKGLIGASATTVASGTTQVASAGKTMIDLVGSVRRVGALFDEVTADTADHMLSLNMVSESMADLGTITKQNVALAEKTDQAASELQALAAGLANVLNAFNLPHSARQGSALSAATASAHGPRNATAGGSSPGGAAAQSAQASAVVDVTFF